MALRATVDASAPLPGSGVAAFLATLLFAGSIAGCSGGPAAGGAPPLGTPITIDAVAVPLDPEHLSVTSVGDFAYAGGLALVSRDTNELHGLSGLVITGKDKLIAVGDNGIFLDARLVLDEAERLVGIADGRITALVGENGQPLSNKEDADAEGLALLPNGDRLVSFERHHRILLYPAGGGPPSRVPAPDVVFPPNSGMEALTADTATGADAYRVGAESTGDTWTCRLSRPMCTEGAAVAMPEAFSLVAMHHLPGTRTAYLLRAFDPAQGTRVILTVVGAGTVVGRLDIAPPMTIDNFEGLAAVSGPGGRVRFYLISDDNFNDAQRTLLLAFDWQPR